MIDGEDREQEQPFADTAKHQGGDLPVTLWNPMRNTILA